MNIPPFVKQAEQELATYGAAPVVTAELSAVSTVELIGLIQLASRHPLLPERQLAFSRDIVEHFARAFKPEHKGIAELIREGWKQEHDKQLSA